MILDLDLQSSTTIPTPAARQFPQRSPPHGPCEKLISTENFRKQTPRIFTQQIFPREIPQ